MQYVSVIFATDFLYEKFFILIVPFDDGLQ